MNDAQAFDFVVCGYLAECPRFSDTIKSLPAPSFSSEFCDQNNIDGRCSESNIDLRPGCDYLTIAHEIAHFILHRTVKDEYKRIGKTFLHKKIFRWSLECDQSETSFLSLLHSIDRIATASEEVEAAKKRTDHDEWELSAVTRTDEALANALAQYVTEKIFPSDLTFLESASVDSFETNGYWKSQTYSQLKPVLEKLCKF